MCLVPSWIPLCANIGLVRPWRRFLLQFRKALSFSRPAHCSFSSSSKFLQHRLWADSSWAVSCAAEIRFCYEKFIFLLFKWKFAVIVVLSRSLVPFPGPVCKNSVEISSRVSFVAKSQCGTFKGVWTSVTRCFIGKYECPRVGRLQ